MNSGFDEDPQFVIISMPDPKDKEQVEDGSEKEDDEADSSTL